MHMNYLTWGCLYLLAIMNNYAMNVSVKISL